MSATDWAVVMTGGTGKALGGREGALVLSGQRWTWCPSWLSGWRSVGLTA